MDLSIIIVNWNSKDYLQKCLAPILENTKNILFEITVIDSASFDGCDQMLKQCFPTVKFIQSSKNLGFAKSNNEAFKVSSGENLLFLNPDTELEGPAIETLLHELTTLPNAGIVGAKLLNSDRSIQTSCIQAFPTIMNQLFDADALRNFFPKAKLWGMRPLFAGKSEPAEVDSVSGASLMIKREVFENAGMFSEDYFMYSEDIDLCFKVRQAGCRAYYVPSAVIVHHGGVSSSQNKINIFSSVMMLESRWRFFQKTRSTWYCHLYRLGMFFAGMVRIGLVILSWPIFVATGRMDSPKGALKNWMAKFRWTLNGEKWVRTY